MKRPLCWQRPEYCLLPAPAPCIWADSSCARSHQARTRGVVLTADSEALLEAAPTGVSLLARYVCGPERVLTLATCPLP